MGKENIISTMDDFTKMSSLLFTYPKKVKVLLTLRLSCVLYKEMKLITVTNLKNTALYKVRPKK